MNRLVARASKSLMLLTIRKLFVSEHHVAFISFIAAICDVLFYRLPQWVMTMEYESVAIYTQWAKSHY